MMTRDIFPCKTKYPDCPCYYAKRDGTCSINECIVDNPKEVKAPNTEPQLVDGIYIQTFAVKDGVRYNAGIINLRDVSKILTGGMLDGLDKIIHLTMPDGNVQ